ncbi:transcriptional regulator [Vibrio owensii]|uniref:Transcriptional regulator n=1 Tax=Vibrio owensii TaxID=696485 RepID=A0AAP9KC76_9VIBR|nr:Rrf2 family transcriptional regulator [Vibrio owensii]AYO17078.1 transcriptional regulator [Vibrio owensii]QGH49225.1 transcriptional regulator [Vibrio owensii]
MTTDNLTRPQPEPIVKKSHLTVFKGKINVALGILGLLVEKGTILTSDDICRELGISISYLEQVIVPLKKVKVVGAQRGPSGGYLLGSNIKASIGDVVRAVDPKAFKSPNTQGLHDLLELHLNVLSITDIR